MEPTSSCVMSQIDPVNEQSIKEKPKQKPNNKKMPGSAVMIDAVGACWNEGTRCEEQMEWRYCDSGDLVAVNIDYEPGR